MNYFISNIQIMILLFQSTATIDAGLERDKRYWMKKWRESCEKYVDIK